MISSFLLYHSGILEVLLLVSPLLDEFQNALFLVYTFYSQFLCAYGIVSYFQQSNKYLVSKALKINFWLFLTSERNCVYFLLPTISAVT